MDLTGIEAWHVWIALGLFLAGLELLVPGVYFVWLAIAALATGVLVFAAEPDLVMQIVSFVFLALIAVFSAKRFLRDSPIKSSDPLLNNRMGRLVGQTATVTQPIMNGSGRVKQGDSEWLASGPDLDKGAHVRITGNEGGTMLVEPLTLIEDEGTLPAGPA
ncbi:NfeD family protein [Altererythrobacter sp. SALINAS58]|uniref:NfeD family protein n=1 Tax=Alteripontixanthobacter muriae TaxID=2705546 RepID=UPI0015771908|nr:NfeD family protein [Alteripontixanthobacter muriae]NTZ43354.1 NfeD family protein [Alteripontixanthobacter muriae]